MVLYSVDHIGEVSLDVGERERLGHDLYYSHRNVVYSHLALLLRVSLTGRRWDWWRSRSGPRSGDGRVACHPPGGVGGGVPGDPQPGKSLRAARREPTRHF